MTYSKLYSKILMLDRVVKIKENITLIIFKQTKVIFKVIFEIFLMLNRVVKRKENITLNIFQQIFKKRNNF